MNKLSLVCQIAPLPIVPANWTRLIIKDVGSVDVPPTLELQKGDYKVYIESYYAKIEVDAPDVAAQQVGLNDLTKAGFSKYARVLVNTTYGEVQEFEPLFFDIDSISAVEVAEIDKSLRSEWQLQCVSNNARLVQWYPVTLEKLNGMSCLHLRFRRQIDNKPIVIVDSYFFFNNDRKHELTLSYRENEAELWEGDFLRVRDSFRITNIR